MPPLEEYRRKRDFGQTPEPSGKSDVEGSDSAGLRYVIQKHDARALHYDLRLELDGVLLSWAVPKGPSLDPHDKRLAVHVEDHPVDYADFEGGIPAGEYGAGAVIVWDTGTWRPLGDARAGLDKGDFKFELFGKKLRGTWVLVRLKPRAGEKRDNWLLIKEKDEAARPRDEYDVLAEEPDSTVSGRSIAAVAEGNAEGNAAASTEESGAVARPAAGAERSQSAAPERPLPTEIDIELATLVTRPPGGDEWIAEAKYDGYRLVLALEGGRAHAFTRSHADWSDRFATLARAAEALPATSAVIDGEAVVFDPGGVSRFGLLQEALSSASSGPGSGSKAGRMSLAAFDLLFLNGHDLRDMPLLQRKDLLRTLLGDQSPDAVLHYADHVRGNADEFYRQACLSGLEGIVCKRAESRYTPGRGRDWQKIKCRQTQELVIGGFTEGEGSRSTLGSLMVGTYEGDRLVYAGRVGTGFDEATVASLRECLDAIEQPTAPFDSPPRVSGHVLHWTEPRLVVEVAFREWTGSGQLRQPVYLGLREDKDAREVSRERPEDCPEGTAPSSDPKPKRAGSKKSGSPKVDFGSDTAVLGVRVTNPRKPLFPDSSYTKLEFSEYYAAIAPYMLAEVANRPLTLVRCPVGRGAGCFYQRHPDAGLPEQIRTLPHLLGGERVELLYVESAEGLVALAQMGAVEVHTWLSRTDAPTRPDRIAFDLDPGPDVPWSQVRAAALLVREECASLGFEPFVKSTGSKGLHVVLPIETVWEFDRVRALAKSIVGRVVSRHPDALTGKMAKSERGGRVYFDYLRNAEGASAVAPYSTRNIPGPPCAVPLAWDELADTLDIRSFVPSLVLERTHEGINPWEELEDSSVGQRVLRAAESKIGA